MMHPPEGLTAAVMWDASEPPDRICELARGPSLPPPAKGSAVDFCHDICTIVYIDKRKNQLISENPTPPGASATLLQPPAPRGASRGGRIRVSRWGPSTAFDNQPSLTCCKASTLDWSTMMDPSKGLVAVACELRGMPLEFRLSLQIGFMS
jgi:hypothetical protein